MADTIKNVRHLATLLSAQCLAAPVVRGGKEFHPMPIAVAGAWVKSGKAFSITRQDLAAMVANFAKRKNEQVVIDYEHASELPEIGRGGPIPAAGWIHSLNLNGALEALVEWTPQAQEMIRSGQYRFFSPAIDWSARDKESGEPQGATLTSGALTNHPFLEELPPIMLTDLESGNQASVTSDPPRRSPLLTYHSSVRLQEMAGIHQDGYTTAVSNQPGGAMKKLSFKKLADRGKRAVCDDAGLELGEVDLEELDLDDMEFEELSTRRSARAATLSETLREGGINLDLAARLADQGRIGFSEYRAAQKAQQLVEKAIAEGKFAPADREFISRLALAEPDRFEAWTRKKPRAVPLGGPTGVSEPLRSPAQDLSVRLTELMREKKLNRQQALRELARTEPDLIQRWRWGGGASA